MAKRLAGRHGYPVDGPFELTLHPDRLEQPIKWKKPCLVFVCSMGDLFHPDVPDEYLDKVFGMMALTPRHTYQLLTKRPNRMYRYLTALGKALDRIVDAAESVTGDCEAACWVSNYVKVCSKPVEAPDGNPGNGTVPRFPLPNVWCGTTVENQRAAETRIKWLQRAPAALRYISVEPMLGHLRLGKWLEHENGIDWVICGDESGPVRRRTELRWVRDLRDQCVDAGVSFFLKQLHDENGRKIGMPKLDGTTWDRFPEQREERT